MVLAVGVLLVGFLLAIAYRETLRQAPDSERARQALVRDVQSGSTLSDQLQRRAETLSGELVRQRDAALTTSRAGDRAAPSCAGWRRPLPSPPCTGRVSRSSSATPARASRSTRRPASG